MQRLNTVTESQLGSEITRDKERDFTIEILELECGLGHVMRSHNVDS